MDTTIKIDEGSTYEYLVPGLIVILLALGMLAIHWVAAVPFLVFGIGIVAIKTGLEIDITNRKIRKYKNLLGYRFGQWVDLGRFVGAELRYNSQYAKLKERPIIIFSPLFMQRDVKTAKTYDLLLINDLEEKLLFIPFTKVGLALKSVAALEKIERFSVTNHVDNWVERKLRTRRR